MQDHEMEEIHQYIAALKSVDSEAFYNKEESEVWPLVHTAVDALSHLGPAGTPQLCTLLDTDFTWSCFYALRILRQTKDPQAVPALIALLGRESDDTLACEEAMLTLQDICESAVEPLLQELAIQFYEQHYNSYLVGALTGIIGQASYEYMVDIVQDYLQNPGKYHGWFHPGDFTFNFAKQQRTDVLPMLRRLLAVKNLDSHERQEIVETIEVLEHPDLYEQRLRQTISDVSESPSADGPR